jgi:hypothetical protein
VWLLPSPRVIFDVNTLVFAATAILVGFQAIMFAVFTKVFAITEGLLPDDFRLKKLVSHINLEVGLIVGSTLLLVGIAGSIYAFGIWGAHFFGSLDTSKTMRIVIPSVTCLALGFQIILSSFFLSVLGLKRR